MGWLSSCQSCKKINFVVEPKGHVSEKDFEITISIAEQNGFNVIDSPKIGRSRTVLFGKK